MPAAAANLPPPPVPLTGDSLLEWIQGDALSLQALKDQNKGALLERIRRSFATPKGTSDTTLFRQFMSYTKLPHCPKKIATSAAGFKATKERVRKRKRNFIDEANLHVCDADRKAFLATIPVHVVEPLKKPYPPFGKIVSETPTIHSKWFKYFKSGKQADRRKKRLPIHHLKRSQLVADIGPTENARLETPDGKLVGLVIRDFCPSADAAAWADAQVKTQALHRRNIRVRPHFLPCCTIIQTCLDFFRWKTRARWLFWDGRRGSAASAPSTGFGM